MNPKSRDTTIDSGRIAPAWHHTSNRMNVIPWWVVLTTGLGGTVLTIALWSAYEFLNDRQEACSSQRHAVDLLILGLGIGLTAALTAALGMAHTAQDRLRQLKMISENVENALRQSKQAAETANRVKSDFLATMSHEIRTPMNVVIGMGDILLESGLNEEQMDFVRKQQEAGISLLDLINQILDMSKIEAGQLHIVDEPVALRVVLREVIDLLKVMAENKGLRLECVVDEAVPEWVLADPLRLRQILFNLLSNAIKFTEQGTITLREGLDDPTTLHMMVEDSGMGIAVEHLEKIFNDFAQTDAGITRRYGGTGLGLAISRRLVELMRGRIWVESHLGRGSVFHVTLPLRPATQPVDPVTPGSRNDFPGASDAALRILLVDDAEDNQRLIYYFLKGTRHRLTMASHGEEALRMIKETPFDLVFMDLQMPVMDGYTAIRLIRQLEQETGRKPLPIVVLTAHTLEGERERSREAGCDLYLTKPITKQRLLEVVQRMGAEITDQA